MKEFKVTHTVSSRCCIKSKNPLNVKWISLGNVLLRWMGLESIFEIKTMKKAQPKIGATVMMKSKRKGILGLSYLIPVLLDVKRFSSLIVVPVIRHSKAWLSSCTIVPGKRNPLIILVLVYFVHSPKVVKLRKITNISPIANEK